MCVCIVVCVCNVTRNKTNQKHINRKLNSGTVAMRNSKCCNGFECINKTINI